MCIASCLTDSVSPPQIALAAVRGRALHRLAVVRRREGVSRRTVARHLHVSVEDVRRQEHETLDMPLSVLSQWASVLGVPIAELLAEPGDSLSAAVRPRAQLVLCAKTAMGILERGTPPIRRLARVLIDELVLIMPELGEITAWPATGWRRERTDLGRCAQQTVSLESLEGACER